MLRVGQLSKIVSIVRNADSLCSEGTNGRTLTYAIGSVPAANMTVALCTSACKAAGYILAGVEYSGECCKAGLPRSPYGKPHSLVTCRLRQ